MCSKQQLRNFLQQICVDAEFPLFHYVSPERYNILIKCRIEKDRDVIFYNDYTKEWIKQFAKFSSTGWIVRNCFPRLKRLLYRKTYVCQHSGYNKKKNLARSNARNKDCRAKIDFKMKIINRNTIKNDRSLKEGLNLNIYIDFEHTHDIRTSEAFKLLKCTPDTDDVFYTYFSQGHTVASAKCYHELLLMFRQGGMSEEDWSNTGLNPPLQHVFYLHRRKKIQVNIPEIMTQKIKYIEESGGAISYNPDLYDIKVVITPFMKSVIENHEMERIIIDSACIKFGFVTIFYVPTTIGALPIASVLHDDNSEIIFNHVFLLTKDLIENQIYKVFEPKIIMANDIYEQHVALSSIFPNALVYVSRTSMCEIIWPGICSDDIKVDSTKRHDLMVTFHSLLYANDMEQAEKYRNELERNNLVMSTTKLKEYLDKIWKTHQLYVAQNDNTIVDTSLRLLKEFILCKCNTFSGLTMIDVFVNILDKYWSQVLHSHLKKKIIMETYTKYLSKNKTVLINLIDIKVNENMYRLCATHYFGKESKKRVSITFRSDTMCCDCNIGRKGRFCEHLNSLFHVFEVNIEMTVGELEMYTKLAGEDLNEEVLKVEPPTSESIPDNDEEISDEVTEQEVETNEQTDEYYCLVKEETEDYCDPLEEKTSERSNVDRDNDDDLNLTNNSIDNNVTNMKRAYENALKNLNNEFRRLNKFFKGNPNASNLNTMVRLGKELAKIKPVERVNLSNMYVEINDRNMDCVTE